MSIGDTFAPPLGMPSLSAGEIFQLYRQYLGRDPDPVELASELDSANKYSAAGIEATIARRGGNAPGVALPPITGLTQQRDVVPGGGPLPILDINDRDLIAGGLGGSLTETLDTSIGTEGFGDILKGIVGLIPGVGPILSPILGALPKLPSGRTPPMLPPGTTPPEISIPIPRAPRAPARIGAGTAAAIAAAAAALGITADEYIRRYGLPAKRRRMNILNPKALRRSTRRVFGFERFARRMITVTHRSHLKGLRRGKKRRAA